MARLVGSLLAGLTMATVVGLAPQPSGPAAAAGPPPNVAAGQPVPFGNAGSYGSVAGTTGAAPVVGMAAAPGGQGYWLLPAPPPPPIGGPSLAGLVIYNLADIPGGVYPKGAKVAALTFDDGPSPVYTPQILQILTQYHVPATFQIIGYEGAARPDLLKLEVSDGMTLTNHTWDHADLATLSPAAFPGEVDATTNLITSVTGQPVKCLRPPGGATNGSVLAQLSQRGLGELLLDMDPSDYLRPGAGVIADRVLSALHPGAIIGLHDSGSDRSQTLAALPAIIAGIQAAGYTLVSVCN